MGYQIEYGPVEKVRRAEKQRTLVAAMTGICLMLFLLLVNSLWPRGREELQEFLFSEKLMVTAAALEEFSQQLEDGADLSYALEVFSTAVNQNADSPSD